MNNRHKRRAEYAQFRRETPGALLTWLLDGNDPSLHKAPPLVVRAAHHWCGGAPPLHLLFIAHLGPTGTGCTVIERTAECGECDAVCNRCWANQRLDEIEQAATEVLRGAVPNGNFEPLSC